MKAYRTQLGSQKQGYFTEYFNTLDEVREWANNLIEKFNMSGSTLEITEVEESEGCYSFNSNSPKKVIEIK